MVYYQIQTIKKLLPKLKYEHFTNVIKVENGGFIWHNEEPFCLKKSFMPREGQLISQKSAKRRKIRSQSVRVSEHFHCMLKWLLRRWVGRIFLSWKLPRKQGGAYVSAASQSRGQRREESSEKTNISFLCSHVKERGIFFSPMRLDCTVCV